MDVAIGFDTSCYTTSVAVVDAGGNAILSRRMLLPVESGQRGLRQSEAVFAHVRQIPQMAADLQTALANHTVKAVAASATPGDDEGSYMPVFTVGLGHARMLAAALQVPCYSVTHQQGHIAAGQIGQAPMAERFVALHLSGGTTDLLLSAGGKLTPLGSSLDLHAGQLVDRVGVAMGLPFPAGAALEALANQHAGETEALLSVSMENGDRDCHLSGAETQCQKWIAEGTLSRPQIAAEVFDVLARTATRMLAAGCGYADIRQALVVGGVASSARLRDLLVKRMRKWNRTIDIRFGKPEFSADNAAGVAWLGMQRYLAGVAE